MTKSLESRRTPVSLNAAEKTLPRLRTLLEQLRLLQETLDLMESIEIEMEDENHEMYRSVTQFNKAFHRLSYEFFKKLDKVERSGAIIRDLEEGIVDFPSTFEGREVFLCWRDGEESIEHWHETESGFAGRKRILSFEK